MKEMDPQSILNKIMKEANSHLMGIKITGALLKEIYSELNEILYVKAYIKILEFSVEKNIDPDKFNEEMEFTSEVFIRIANIENCSLVEAANKYLKEMDIQFPDFTTVAEHAKNFNLNEIKNRILPIDPFEKWKGQPKDSPQAREQIKKLMASIGWLLITKKLDGDLHFNQYITEELDKRKVALAGEYWSMYTAKLAATKFKEDE